MNDPQEMFAAYAEGKLNAAQVAELERWLREDRDRAKAYVRQAMLDCHLIEVLREQNFEQVAADLSDESQFGALLKALDAPEGAAQTVVLDAPKPAKPKRERHDSDLTARDAVSALSYLALKALRTPAGITTSIAAALLLAAALFFALPSNDNPAPPPNLATPPNNKPAESAQPIPRDTVATLTATHNAVWDNAPAERALARGSQLYPNTRLTLTAGFAEITTARGAVAILEAPTTIQLTDNNNALQLHSGKLVGICETDSSKGFLVRTPHMDVIDLGTQFGVEVSSDTSSEVHVFKGAVQAVRRQGRDSQPVYEVLLTGQGARSNTDQPGLDRIASDLSRFSSAQQLASRIDPGASEAGIAQLSGQVQWTANRYELRNLGEIAGADHALVFEELNNYTLDSDLPVTVSGPGTYREFQDVEAAPAIPMGTVIRSYIVIYKSGASKASDDIKGEVRFKGKVLGVIANEDDWQSFNARLPGRAFGLGGKANPLLEGQTDSDQIDISPDGLGLKMTLSVSPGTDAFRVIVEEPLNPG